MKVSIRHTLDRFIQTLQRAPDITMREVDLTVQQVAIEGARIAKHEAPMALSTLVNSIKNEQIGMAFHRIVAGASYARYVEEGAEPGGWPPQEAIRRWIRQHNMQPRQARDERSLAFLISRSIYRRGTKAQPFMEPARETSQQRLMALLPAAAHRGMEVALS